ncbi:hypothetical protein N7492_005940 [Penicillium capsulatum]|uniref:Mid2 domain-containing protein n=1 Tax=Penicillium capsulatum TaxID=69766 RepID=A0A9W9IEA4_9EURO|nr:hypothetical protein N7492_005940 [Penicillium capsulatum]KAJ6134957.1 hypothetical protein N7512_000117 [Penicillium capsulatum]
MAQLAWVLLILAAAVQVVRGADEDFQIHFEVPDGSKEDFEVTFYNGDTENLKWAGWTQGWIDDYMNGIKSATLYLVAWNADVSDYQRPISTVSDITKPGSYPWTFDISDKDLAKTNRYCLTFIPEDYSYTTNQYQMYSKGFNVRNKENSRASATPTAVKPVASGSGGLSTGAKAGIGVGAGVGGLAVLAAIGFFVIRRLRRPSSPEAIETPQPYMPCPPQELGDTPRELGGSHPDHELPGYDSKPVMQELYTPPAELPSAPDAR